MEDVVVVVGLVEVRSNNYSFIMLFVHPLWWLLSMEGLVVVVLTLLEVRSNSYSFIMLLYTGCSGCC